VRGLSGIGIEETSKMYLHAPNMLQRQFGEFMPVEGLMVRPNVGPRSTSMGLVTYAVDSA
jgi:hypothetical protein